MTVATFTRVRVERPDDTHCIHGTFVGDWAGADYMCGPCEAGVLDRIRCDECGDEFWTDFPGDYRACDPNPARAIIADKMRQSRAIAVSFGILEKNAIIRQGFASNVNVPRRIHDPIIRQHLPSTYTNHGGDTVTLN